MLWIPVARHWSAVPLAGSALVTGLTGQDGAYVLAELPAGGYVVVAEASGLSPVAQNVIVNVGADTTADFDLTGVQKRVE